MNKNKILKSNISSGMLWKALGLIFVYLSVPLLLNYLGDKYYGVWVTIFAVVNTAYFMDLGIALGLKNKLTESLSKKDFISANIYISTAYISISFIVLLLLIIGILFVINFNMQQIFNVNIVEKKLKIIVLISIILVLISVILNIYKSIYMSFQKSAKVELAMALYQGFVFLQILLLPRIVEQSLLIVSLIYGLTNIIIAFIFTAFFFKKNKAFSPSFSSFSKDKISEILGQGFNFFIIQLALIIILSTDNFLITNLINPESTTAYSIVYKVFQPFLIISTLIFTPLWTLYTDAYYNKDIKWIKLTLRKLNYLFLILILILVLLYFNFNWIIKLWIQKEINYSKTLLLLMAAFILIRVYADIYMTFLNGIGKIKLQMWLYIFGAIINIPLSIIFIKYFDLGSSGVILATCISLIGLTVVMPIQTYEILKKTNIKKIQQ